MYMFDNDMIILLITCRAVMLYSNWSISFRPGAVPTLYIQYRTAEFNITTRTAILIDNTTWLAI